MRCWLKHIAYSCTALTFAATASPAAAAVRQCAPGVTSEIAQADNELMGKRKALMSWTTKAAKLGPAYTSWRIADKKVLGCKKGKTPSDGFQCVAYASPCTIVQAPNTPNRPKRTRKRFGPNTPFEV
ncbi:MAG: hypothetical protein ABL901_08440 [Hyphomicrobiaceae bacterium]